MALKSLKARLIGIIGKPHGVKGELTARLLTDYPKSIKKGDFFFLDEKCTKKVKIENINISEFKGYSRAVFKFEGIDSRDKAEELREMPLYRSAKTAPKLKTDEFWVDDIVACKVYSRDNSFIGTVVEVLKYTSNDNLVIKKGDRSINIRGVKEDVFLVPFIESYIGKVDTKDKKIVLKRIPEYI